MLQYWYDEHKHCPSGVDVVGLCWNKGFAGLLNETKQNVASGL